MSVAPVALDDGGLKSTWTETSSDIDLTNFALHMHKTSAVRPQHWDAAWKEESSAEHLDGRLLLDFTASSNTGSATTASCVCSTQECLAVETHQISTTIDELDGRRSHTMWIQRRFNTGACMSFCGRRAAIQQHAGQHVRMSSSELEQSTCPGHPTRGGDECNRVAAASVPFGRRTYRSAVCSETTGQREACIVIAQLGGLHVRDRDERAHEWPAGALHGGARRAHALARDAHMPGLNAPGGRRGRLHRRGRRSGDGGLGSAVGTCSASAACVPGRVVERFDAL
ncbi:hypothetical protein EVJ58_g5492 [Rhodofomes roseus]|uniref:Uncharacterized protein n=1 Tax=Rhodofomes roseus TaxID=34475 RepID=A0A4Y9YDT4_9APHY|nr:hypothetical protein EVJ58_g5492 [Rhodofomes roseus]